MTAIKTAHSRFLDSLIQARRMSVMEAMAAGVNKRTYYRLVGQIQGLDDALRLSEEADFKLNGEIDADS